MFTSMNICCCTYYFIKDLTTKRKIDIFSHVPETEFWKHSTKKQYIAAIWQHTYLKKN